MSEKKDIVELEKGLLSTLHPRKCVLMCFGPKWISLIYATRNLHAVYTVKPKFIQTPSTFLTLSQYIRYSLENGNMTIK